MGEILLFGPGFSLSRRQLGCIIILSLLNKDQVLLGVVYWPVKWYQEPFARTEFQPHHTSCMTLSKVPKLSSPPLCHLLRTGIIISSTSWWWGVISMSDTSIQQFPFLHGFVFCFLLPAIDSGLKIFSGKFLKQTIRIFEIANCPEQRDEISRCPALPCLGCESSLCPVYAFPTRPLVT